MACSNASLKPDLIKIPPFRDAHVHFMTKGRPMNPGEVSEAGRCYPFQGIYAVEDMGHASGLGLAAKKILNGLSGSPFGFYTSGRALYKKGTYGRFLGQGVSGKEEIKRAIRGLVKEGADYIKVINSGLVSPEREGQVTPGGFSKEEWTVISGEAQSHRLGIRCHANTDRAVRSALAGGADSIEHGFFIEKETLHWMAESRTAWVPTVFALKALQHSLSPEAAGGLDRIIAGHLEALHYAINQGVQVRVGTDSGSRGVPHGTSFFRELQCFQQAGLSEEQILEAACQEKEEMERGNYLLVEKDFIRKERVAGAYYRHRPLKRPGEEVP
jgi:hypothetical protein